MKILGCAFVLALAVCLSVNGQNHAVDESESERVLALENAWNQAEVHGDTRALELLLGSSFVYTDADGTFMDRPRFLSHVQRGDDQYEQLSSEQQVAYVHADVAVVTGIYREKIRLKGKLATRRGRFTDTWIKQQRAWMCIASQVTLIGH